MNKIGFYISSALVALALLSSTLFVVDQRQFGVVYALGQIKEVVTEPGLHVKLPPPLQNVTYIDKRLLTLDNADTEPMLTAEKQRMVIDWYVRWRISDPSDYIRNVGLDERAGSIQLSRVVRNAFQEEINKRTVKELLSVKRETLMQDVKEEVQAKVKGAKPWGIDVIDVRITRADYVDTITESVYRRMEAERKRVANELRSTGGAEGEKIRADADRQRTQHEEGDLRQHHVAEGLGAVRAQVHRCLDHAAGQAAEACQRLGQYRDHADRPHAECHGARLRTVARAGAGSDTRSRAGRTHRGSRRTGPSRRGRVCCTRRWSSRMSSPKRCGGCGARGTP